LFVGLLCRRERDAGIAGVDACSNQSSRRISAWDVVLMRGFEAILEAAERDCPRIQILFGVICTWCYAGGERLIAGRAFARRSGKCRDRFRDIARVSRGVCAIGKAYGRSLYAGWDCGGDWRMGNKVDKLNSE